MVTDRRRSWLAVARLDHRVARQSRLVRYLLYLLVGIFLLGAYIFPVITSGEVTSDRFAVFMTGIVGLVVPLVGLLLGYNVVVGDRESGRITLLLSMSHDRGDVLAGKLLTRGLYLVGALFVGMVGAAVLVWYPFGSVSLDYAAYLLLTVGLGVIFFGIGVTLSTLTAARQYAAIGAFGIFFLFVVVWNDLLGVALFVLDEVGLNGTAPDWLLFVHGAEPGLLYDRIVAAHFEGVESGPYLGADAPWYLGEWVALGLFALWVVLPVAAGYYRFVRADL